MSIKRGKERRYLSLLPIRLASLFLRMRLSVGIKAQPNTFDDRDQH